MNLCTKCKKKPAEINKKSCRQCLDKHNAFQKKYRKKNIATGLCVHCWQPTTNGKQCELCRSKRNRLYKKRREKNKKNGICVDCNKPVLPGHTRCHRHNKKISDATLNRYYELDIKGVCVRCSNNQRAGSTKHCEPCLLKVLSYSLWKTKKRWRDLLDLFNKQNRICVYSGKKLVIGKNASIDHIIPESKGGSSNLENLQWVDSYINSMKSNKTEEEFFDTIVMIAEYRKLQEVSNHMLLESRIHSQ